MKTSFFFVFLLTFTLTKAQQTLKVKVNKGDALISIFNKYQLKDFKCNENEFLNLNKLDNKELILSGFSYYLPVKVYSYDGKSIRSSIGIDDWDIAKKIESYNLNLESDSIKKENYKSGELWVPFHLTTECSLLKPINRITEKSLKYSIFGKDNELVTIIDNALKNKVFYLVSGHGGPDPGAIGKYNESYLCEDEYSYDITLRLAKNLISHGAMVYLIIRDSTDGIRSDNILACDKDETCWKEQAIPLNQKKRLQQRSDMVNELYLKNKYRYKKQYLIVIHIDSQSKSKRADMFFYHHAKSKMGKSLAHQLHQTIKGQYKHHQKGRGYTGTVRTRNLHMIRESHPATVYIELGNIMNTKDQKRFIMESNRQAVADWLTLGILEN